MEQNTKDRILSLLSNEEKAKELSIINSIERVAEFFHSNGIELSKDDLTEIEKGAQVVVEQIEKGELTADDLEQIAGGGVDKKYIAGAAAVIGALSMAIFKFGGDAITRLAGKKMEDYPRVDIGLAAGMFISGVAVTGASGYFLYDKINSKK